MNHSSTEQDYMEHLAKISPPCPTRDLEQVVVELVELSKACTVLEDMSVEIRDRIQSLALLLRDTE